MVRRVLFLSMLVLLVVTVRLAPAFDAGDGSEPMDQYQEDFKRQNLGAALGVDPNTVERLLQIDQKYKAEKRQAMQNAKAAFQQLQRVMSQPKPPEQEVAAILDNMMKLRTRKADLGAEPAAGRKKHPDAGAAGPLHPRAHEHAPAGGQGGPAGAERPPGGAAAGQASRPPGSAGLPARRRVSIAEPALGFNLLEKLTGAQAPVFSSSSGRD